jgi:hypothetical protein
MKWLDPNRARMIHHVKYLKGRKMMKLSDVAVIAHEGARQAVHTAMEARSRPSPWEVTEAWLKIRVMESLYDSFRESTSGLRIVDELSADKITNIKVGDVWRTHPFDLSVLYPVDDGDPWSERSIEALGLIELKKYDKLEMVRKDMELLGKAVQHGEGSSRLLKWVLFVVFVNGHSRQAVIEKAGTLAKEGSGCELFRLQVATQPERAPPMPGRDSVKDQYFQIVCLGRLLE